jgi:hypothetical protein
MKVASPHGSKTLRETLVANAINMANLTKKPHTSNADQARIAANARDIIETMVERASGAHADNCEWDVMDWLDDTDKPDYCKAYRLINGDCPNCGENKKGEGCEYCL